MPVTGSGAFPFLPRETTTVIPGSGEGGGVSGGGDSDFYGDFGSPDDLPSDYPEIAAAVRFLLTGDPESDTPSSAVIDYLVPDAFLDLIRAYPCMGYLDPLQTTLTGADLRYFNRAVGAQVALLLLNTPAAAEYARTLVKVKIGPVEETTQDGLVIETAKTWLIGEYQRALKGVTCAYVEMRAQARLNTPTMGTIPQRGPRVYCSDRRSSSPLYNGNRGGY